MRLWRVQITLLMLPQQHVWYFVIMSYDSKAGKRQEMRAVFLSITFLVVCLKLLLAILLHLLSCNVYLQLSGARVIEGKIIWKTI